MLALFAVEADGISNGVLSRYVTDRDRRPRRGVTVALHRAKSTTSSTTGTVRLPPATARRFNPHLSCSLKRYTRPSALPGKIAVFLVHNWLFFCRFGLNGEKRHNDKFIFAIHCHCSI